MLSIIRQENLQLVVGHPKNKLELLNHRKTHQMLLVAMNQSEAPSAAHRAPPTERSVSVLVCRLWNFTMPSVRLMEEMKILPMMGEAHTLGEVHLIVWNTSGPCFFKEILSKWYERTLMLNQIQQETLQAYQILSNYQNFTCQTGLCRSLSPRFFEHNYSIWDI